MAERMNPDFNIRSSGVRAKSGLKVAHAKKAHGTASRFRYKMGHIRRNDDIEADGCGGQAQSNSSAVTASADEEAAMHIGNGVFYYPSRPLSKGSCVYEGRRQFTDGIISKEIAVKLFSKKQRYQEVVQNMMRVTSHPNVVDFVSCGRNEDDSMGGFYIAMDLYQKLTLADIDAGKIEEDERKNIFIHICHGLKYLHDSKMAHGDLKPSNILFSRDGRRAVVAGFGCSTNAESEELELKADIYSLGAVGFYVLSGYHIFGNEGEEHTLVHRDVNVKSTPKLDILGPLEKDLFEKMLSRVPKERPSVNEVLQHCMFWSLKKTATFFEDMWVYFKNVLLLYGSGKHVLQSLSKPLLEKDVFDSQLQKTDEETLDVKGVIRGTWLKIPIDMEKEQLKKRKETSQHRREELSERLKKGGLKPEEMERCKQGLATLEEEPDRIKKEENNAKEVQSLLDEMLTLNDKCLSLLNVSRSGKHHKEVEELKQKLGDWKSKWMQVQDGQIKSEMNGYIEDPSLKGLIWYVRNYTMHHDYTDLIKKLLDAFPKLVPFLIRVMEPILTDEDKEEFLLKTPHAENLCLTEDMVRSIMKQTATCGTCDSS